jgi:ABC-type sugar transport system ATPase subunit
MRQSACGAARGGAVEGVVELVELNGPEQILVVRWAGQRLHLLVDRSRSWQPGQRLAPSFDGASATFWPRQ